MHRSIVTIRRRPPETGENDAQIKAGGTRRGTELVTLLPLWLSCHRITTRAQSFELHVRANLVRGHVGARLFAGPALSCSIETSAVNGPSSLSVGGEVGHSGLVGENGMGMLVLGLPR